ncbi:PEP-CTERM sorting domain-containing protein [Duganella sp. CF517]|uniref:PEP-CTERM sorting domain-containing protein n=1 Tax=Duganella sp. CF517 TaxID=1881038 RepID=UPI001E5E7A95|nr:PEP-CTERM sorting domain-containing protein [Duganella sp. CF517]
MLIIGLLAGSAHAAVVFDSFGPYDFLKYNVDNGTDEAGVHYEQSHAVRFTLTAETQITSIKTAIDNESGLGKLTLGIMASVKQDATGLPMPGDFEQLPSGKLIYSSDLTGVLSNATLSNLNWTLGAGTYWLTGTSAFGTSATWTTGNTANYALSTAAGVWSGGLENALSPAALIEGTQLAVSAVPEPETYAMMLAGVALVAGMARRRQRAV